VQFYASDEELCGRVADFVLDGSADAAVAILVATAAHRDGFARRLREAGMDVEAAESTGALVMLDAQDLLTQFFDGAGPNPRGFDAVIGGLVRSAAATGRPVRIYGEMVAVLWDAGLVNAALQLEGLWNDLGHRASFTLLCGYPADAALAGPDAIDNVCCAHSAVAGRPIAARPASITRTFEMAATAPAAVRELVRSQLTEWGVATSLDDACLIASELVNNALLHARSDVTVTLSSSDRGVRVAVADSSVALPSPGRPTPTSCSGRGLRIIDSLAVRWGYDLQSSGKVVWAEFAC
jgi:hypothetical protein